MKVYAVLISGGLAEQDGYNEFWNDLVLMWRNLQKSSDQYEYKISDENIFVIYGNGVDYNDASNSEYNPNIIKCKDRVTGRKFHSNFPNRKHSDSFTDYAASIENIQEVFEGLKNTMGNKDILFVWTFGHGFRHGRNSWLYLGNEEKLYDLEFANLVKQITCRYRIMCMQQCFSGGFIDYLKDDNKNIILTACADTEFAYRADDRTDNHAEIENEIIDGITYNHGEFNFHLFKALLNSNDEIIPEGTIYRLPEKIRRVFDYIVAKDTTHDTPQYFDSDSGCIGVIPEQNLLKAVWSLGSMPDDIQMEFSYPISNMYSEEKDKIIYLKIDGIKKHTFKIDDLSYSVDIKPRNKFGFKGEIKADYYHRLVYFEGNIINKTSNPYCRGQDYSMNSAVDYPVMDSRTGLTCKIVIFNWV